MLGVAKGIRAKDLLIYHVGNAEFVNQQSIVHTVIDMVQLGLSSRLASPVEVLELVIWRNKATSGILIVKLLPNIVIQCLEAIQWLEVQTFLRSPIFALGITLLIGLSSLIFCLFTWQALDVPTES